MNVVVKFHDNEKNEDVEYETKMYSYKEVADTEDALLYNDKVENVAVTIM